MNHALVLINGKWVSFGLHIPSDDWSTLYRSLQLVYGRDSVSYTFLTMEENVGTVADLHKHLSEEVDMANEAQLLWNAGQLSFATSHGRLNLQGGIDSLRSQRFFASL